MFTLITISTVTSYFSDLEYYDIATINERCQRICDQWDLLGTLTQQRREALDVSKYFGGNFFSLILLSGPASKCIWRNARRFI